MTDGIMLISSTKIEFAEYFGFLGEQGVVFTPNDPSFEGYIERDTAHIWIRFCKGDCDEAITYDDPKIRNKLGALPETQIKIEIAHANGSHLLAVEFAINFAPKWPIVVDNLVGKVYSMEELYKLKTLGDGLSLH